MLKRLAFAAALCLAANASAADMDRNELTAKITTLDTKLFDAYNACDLPALEALVEDDLEFYHDKTGLSVGRKTFIESISKYVCGKTHRTLTPGTLEAYPLKDYGAVEIGIHTFCATDKAGQCTTPGAPAKFVQLWKETNGTWRLSRVISYDHH
ncbi:MAG: nuclear transport factor 2 family protein [Micropepsaceae bacterium]